MTTQENKVIHLLDLQPLHVQNWLSTFDAVLTDCDGVLWMDNVPIENSPEVITALQALGKRIYFVTNNAMRTRREVHQHAINLGYRVTEADILVPSHSVAQYLHDLNFKQRAYFIGHPATAHELDAMGIRHFGVGPDVLPDTIAAYMESADFPLDGGDVGAVIVGYDEHFNFCKLLKASHFLNRNPQCHFLATNGDAIFKCANSVCKPDTGALLKAVEVCANREAVQLGKPSPKMCEHLVRNGLIQPERTLMIGDSAPIDIVFGRNCGFQTLLVGCGQTKWSELEQMMTKGAQYAKCIPQYYLPKLGDLLPFIPK